MDLFQKLFPKGNDYALDIHTAASIGCEERVRDIIVNSDKSVINQSNSSGWTPLMYATCCANFRMVAFLLDEGALTGTQNNLGHTALILAAKWGNTDAVGMLIDSGAPVNEKDGNGWSALSYAAAFGHRSVVQLLIEKGATVDIVEKKDGLTPLMLASAAGHEMIVKDLIQLGANLNMNAKSGDCARSLAHQNGHYKVQILIENHTSARNNHSSRSRNSNHPGKLDLQLLLNELQLSKYYHIFEKHEIDLETFWMLSEDDLKEIGIQILGPRKKLCSAIARWYQNQLAHGNPDNEALINKLLLDNRRFEQIKDELKTTALQEMELRKAAEHNLSEGIKTLKTFSDFVQRTMACTVNLEEKLKQNHANLKKLLACTPDTSWTRIRMDVVLPLMDQMEKLIDDIHHYSVLSLKQTQFSN